MKEITGDIWALHDAGNWITIPTNGAVNSRGECVMGRGLALDVKMRWPDFPTYLGDVILRRGNGVIFWWPHRIVTFPVKHHWRERADLDLIKTSAEELVGEQNTKILAREKITTIFLPRVGCGNGRLSWEIVQPILAAILDDRFIIVSRSEDVNDDIYRSW